MVQMVHRFIDPPMMCVLHTVFQPPPKRPVTSELLDFSIHTLSQSPEERPQVIRYEKVTVSLAFHNLNIE